MRVILFFAMGFAAACALYGYLLGWVALLIAAALALAASVLLLTLGREKRLCRLFACVSVGICLGSLWSAGFDRVKLAPIAMLDGMEDQFTIVTTDYSRLTQYGSSAEGELLVGDKTYKVLAYLDTTDIQMPGTRVTGTFRLRFTAPGGASNPTYHRGDGIFLLAYPRGGMTIEPGSVDEWKYQPAHIHENLLTRIRAVFPEDTASFACALLLGDSSGLDYATDTAFKLSGIRHMIAVSGLHVSILFSMVHLFGKNRFVSAALGIPVLVVFSAIAGFTPSIVRACLMQLIMLLGGLTRREYDPPTGLSVAVVVMLLVNPQSVTGVGFQLSVASVAGILLLYKPIRTHFMSRLMPERKKKTRLARMLIDWFVSSLAVSLSAMVFTTPLTAIYFGSVSLVSPLTNLLTIWLVTFIFCAIVAVCALSVLYLPAGAAVAGLVSWPIRFVILVAKGLGNLPFAAVYTENVYFAIWLVMVYVLLILFVVLGRRDAWVLTASAAALLCLCVLFSWMEQKTGTYRVTVLDVGQGQCVLLQSGGKTFMVDCGGSDAADTADKAAAALLGRGVRELDGLILTHYDSDHVGAAQMLLTRVGCKALYLPDCEDSSGAAGELPPGTRVSALTILDWGVGRLTIFPGEKGKSDNESSLCVLFHTEKCDILITGDRTATGELPLLASGLLTKLDVLIAGHHGAADSTGIPLLRGTRPDTVVISVEADNPYGHPSEELLYRLALFRCIVRRTDREGTIVIRG